MKGADKIKEEVMVGDSNVSDEALEVITGKSLPPLVVGNVVQVIPEVLRYIDGNRSVDEKHVAKLVTAIKTRNLLHINPIKITCDYKIVDGQHRVCAAIILKIPTVPCLAVGSVTLEEVQAVNACSRRWTSMDLAVSYAKRGIKSYQDLLDFMRTTDFTVDTALRILNDSVGGRNQTAFNTGNFVIKCPLSKAYALADEVMKFRQYLPSAWCFRNFVCAYLTVRSTPGFDYKRLLHKCTLMPLRKMPSMEEYIEQFDRVYNYRAPVTDKLRLIK